MTRRPTSATFITRVLAAGALAIAGLGVGAGVGASTVHAESSLQCDSTFANEVFPDVWKYGWVTADTSDSGTVTGTGYSLQYSYSLDFATKTATVNATLTSTKYYMVAANLWYVLESDTNSGLPIQQYYPNNPTQSWSSQISWDNGNTHAIYGLSFILRSCTSGSPETTAASPETTSAGGGGTDSPGTSGGSSGSGSGLPATGNDAVSIALWAVLLAGGGATVAFTARRPRRTTR